MKISFVIPAHNEEKLIGACLKSVFAEIDRMHDSGEHLEAEVVVVDNASTDQTREEALKFTNVTVVREGLKGLVYARRAGFVATDGELVANIDSDTVVPEGWLTTVLLKFKKDSTLAVLSGPYIYYDLPAWRRAFVKAFYFPAWCMHHLGIPVVQGGNFVLRRTLWEQAGGFDITISFYGEDTDVARRCAQVGRVEWTWKLPMYTSGRRLNEEGMLRTAWVYTLNFFHVHATGKPATKKYSDIRIDA